MALRAADMGAWDYRLDTGDVFWDERARNQWGIPLGDRIDYDDAIARIHDEDRERTVAAVDRAVAGVDGGAYEREFRVVWPDGSIHWIASHGQVEFAGEGESRRAVRFIGVNREITAHRLGQDFARALTRVNESLTSTLERREVLRRVVAEGSSALGCPRAVLELREPGGWLVSEVRGLPEHLRGLHLSDEEASVANAVALAGDVLAIEDGRHDSRINTSTVLRYACTAVLAVPLIGARPGGGLAAVHLDRRAAPVRSRRDRFRPQAVDLHRALARERPPLRRTAHDRRHPAAGPAVGARTAAGALVRASAPLGDRARRRGRRLLRPLPPARAVAWASSWATSPGAASPRPASRHWSRTRSRPTRTAGTPPPGCSRTATASCSTRRAGSCSSPRSSRRWSWRQGRCATRARATPPPC